MTRERLHEIIFEADTPAGRTFDVTLILAILLSVTAVVLESVPSIRVRHGALLRNAEWFFTVLFSVEYVLRMACVRRPGAYARSFYGVVDLLAILPTYLSLFFPGSHSLLVIRSLRLLRVFRVFKVARYLSELTALTRALRATGPKITVFLFTVLTLVLILGTAMYVIEGRHGQITSIPEGIYWAIITVTTVGYGDVVPQTTLGRGVAAAAMLLGYTMIIIPTGIFSVELVQQARVRQTSQNCPACTRYGHEEDAVHCKHCGAKL